MRTVKLKRLGPGFYSHLAGFKVDKAESEHYANGGWNITYPDCDYPDEWVPTLAMAREFIEIWLSEHRDPSKD